MNKWLSVVMALGASTFAWAQPAEGVKPSNPVLQRAPLNATWTVYFFRDRKKVQEAISKQGLNAVESDAAEETNLPKSLTVSKDGNIYREVTVWANGRTTEKWIIGDLQLYEMPSGGIARSILPTFQYDDSYSDYRRSDFEELEWVSLNNFQGTKEVDGAKVFEFRTDPSKRRLTPKERSAFVDPDNRLSGEKQVTPVVSTADATPYTAYLDTRTQLPLYLDDGQTVRIYKFSDNPPGKLVIPSRFQAEFDLWKKELNRWRPRSRTQ